MAYILLQYPKESETFVAAEIEELRKKHRVDIFSVNIPHTKGNARYAKKLYNPLKLLRWALYLLPRSWRDIRYVPSALWIAEQMKHQHYDHLHTWFSASTATISYIVSKETGVPFSFSTHSRDVFVRRESDALLKDKIRHATFVLVPSQWHARYMVERFGFAEKYHIVPNSIDVKKFQSSNKKKIHDVLFIGRDVEKKGLPYLKKALEMLPDCRFVHISGGVSGEDLIRTIQQSRIFVLPSIIAKDGDSEGLPTVLMEAMACGLPVVSTSIRALPEMVEGCGLLVEQKNPEALAKAIKKLLHDTLLARIFGAQGRKRALERFDVVKNTKKLEQLITKVRLE